MQNQNHTPAYVIAIAFLLSLTPLLGVLTPRVLAYFVPVVGLIGFAASSLHTKSATVIPPKFASIALGIFALTSASTFWAFDTELITLEKPIKLAPIFLGIVLLYAVMHHTKAMLKPLLAGALPVACILAGALLLVDFINDSIIYRAMRDGEADIHGGNFSHLNRPAIVLSILSVVSLFLLIQCKPKAYKIYTVALGAILLAIASLTHSQSMHISLLIAGLTALCLPYGWQRSWMVISALLIALVMNAPFLSQWLFTNVSAFAMEHEWLRHGYAAPRMEIWDFVSRRALESPFLGHGIEATRHILDFDITYLYHQEPTILHPHNFAVQIWIEFGALGALLASIALTLTLHGIWKNDVAGRRVQTSLLAMCLILAAITYGLWQSWWIGMLGLTLCLAQLFSTSSKASQ